MRRWILAILLLLPAAIFAVEAENAPKIAVDSTTQQALESLIAGLIRDQLDPEYIDDDKWHQTRKMTTGLEVKGKPFEWDLRRKKEVVNDGEWEEYRVRLVDPANELHVEFAELRMPETGVLKFDLTTTAKLAGKARYEKWNRGMKGVNGMAEANAVVELRIAGEVQFRAIQKNLLPGVAVEPKIDVVQIKLRAFDLDRLSKVRGNMAHEFGDSLKPMIERELTKREPKIVEKINKSIAKRKAKLEFSPDELLSSGWEKAAKRLGL